MKLTGWYRGDQKPVRIGPYLRDYPWGAEYSWWNGEYFGNGHQTPMLAKQLLGISCFQNLPWRGVAK